MQRKTQELLGLVKLFYILSTNDVRESDVTELN